MRELFGQGWGAFIRKTGDMGNMFLSFLGDFLPNSVKSETIKFALGDNTAKRLLVDYPADSYLHPLVFVFFSSVGGGYPPWVEPTSLRA